MPGNFLRADTGLSTLGAGGTADEKIERITDYLYMLLEQLRYTLSNLQVENFNEAELDDLIDTITEPIYVSLENESENVAKLSLTADRLVSRMSSAEGDLSELGQTAASLISRISTAEGGLSELSQTATALVSRISSAEGSVSALTQTLYGITLSVENGSDSSSIKLLSNGVQIGSSGTIRLDGMVSFSDLASAGGRTVINGANIKTGIIDAVDVEGVTFRSLLSRGGDIGGEIKMYYAEIDRARDLTLAGGIRLDDGGAGNSTDSRYRMFIHTDTVDHDGIAIPFAMKLESAGGFSIVSGERAYIESGNNFTLVTRADSHIYIGTTQGEDRRAGGVHIGAAGEDVYLNGNVYINGVKQ